MAQKMDVLERVKIMEEKRKGAGLLQPQNSVQNYKFLDWSKKMTK